MQVGFSPLAVRLGPCFGDQTAGGKLKLRSWPTCVFMMGIKLHPVEHFTDLCTIQEEENNDESSRVAFPIIERMEGEGRMSRRSSDSDSLNSSYKVLSVMMNIFSTLTFARFCLRSKDRSLKLSQNRSLTSVERKT